MLKPIQLLLERLGQRCLALAAGMLASTLEGMQLKHLAEQQCELEQEARRYEEDGMPDVANSLREGARAMAWDDPASRGSKLLGLLLSEPPQVVMALGKETEAAAGSGGRELAQRQGSKPRRQRSAEPAADASPAPLTGDFRFPSLSPDSPAAEKIP